MDNQPSERKTKFQQLVEQYEQYLTEGGFPALAPIAPGGGGAPNSATASTSALDTVIDTDPNVVNAKKKAASAVELALKKKQGTITNPA